MELVVHQRWNWGVCVVPWQGRPSKARSLRPNYEDTKIPLLPHEIEQRINSMHIICEVLSITESNAIIYSDQKHFLHALLHNISGNIEEANISLVVVRTGPWVQWCCKLVGQLQWQEHALVIVASP